MPRFWAVAALLLVGASQVSDRLPLHVGGRVVEEPGDYALRFGWPGVYVEGRFRGTDVTASIVTRTELFKLYVDGTQRAILGPDKLSVTIEGLPAGDHHVRLEKLTESQSGGARFLGFFTNGTALAAPPDRPRAIEFIGDSHSVGYGNTSATRKCTPQQIHDRTDTQQAFGPLVAKKLGADYRVIAYSGYGIVRNYNGSNPGQDLPGIYARTIPGEEDEALAAIDWAPQLIVINLGTNDFSTPLHPDELWRDAAVLKRDYRENYANFIGRLMVRQPQARFLLMAPASFADDVAAVAADVETRAPGKVQVLPLGTLQLTGCDWHPSLADHKAMAGLIEAKIATMPGLWDDDRMRLRR